MRTAAPARTNRKRSRVIVPGTHMLELICLYDETSEPADREDARYRRAEAGGRVSALKRGYNVPVKDLRGHPRLPTAREDEHDGKSTDQIEDRRVSP
jgi:hypothetical protein